MLSFDSGLFKSGAFFILHIIWSHWRTQRALECHSQWQIPSGDAIHFASPLQLISLLCIRTSPSTQPFAAQGCFVLAFSEAGLNTLLIILPSRNFWSWWRNQRDKDSGPFLPQCLNHFLVARSLLMEGLNIPKAPGICWVGYFGLLWKWQLTFKKHKDRAWNNSRGLAEITELGTEELTAPLPTLQEGKGPPLTAGVKPSRWGLGFSEECVLCVLGRAFVFCGGLFKELRTEHRLVNISQ